MPTEGTAPDAVTLHGYAYSVYTRIVRVVLSVKGVRHTFADVNPFETADADRLARMHPFRRVPVLDHAGFRVFETCAITRYLDAAFLDPPLTSADPRTAARIAQCVAVIDAYGYVPMVRQVFAHRVFRPREGEACDEAEVARGVATAAPVLDALEGFATEGLILSRARVTLAECHVGPMLDYFAMAPEGRALLAERPALAAWWSVFSGESCMRETRPAL